MFYTFAPFLKFCYETLLCIIVNLDIFLTFSFDVIKICSDLEIMYEMYTL